jgi:hypothetical protein
MPGLLAPPQSAELDELPQLAINFAHLPYQMVSETQLPRSFCAANIARSTPTNGLGVKLWMKSTTA